MKLTNVTLAIGDTLSKTKMMLGVVMGVVDMEFDKVTNMANEDISDVSSSLNSNFSSICDKAQCMQWLELASKVQNSPSSPHFRVFYFTPMYFISPLHCITYCLISLQCIS